VPKMKTHKGTAKRVHLTGTGKAMIRHPNPKRAKRSRNSMRALRTNVAADKTVARTLNVNLPYGKD